MPPELRSLMERFNHLGRLLPQGEDEQAEAIADRVRCAELKVVLREMRKVRRQIDAFLAEHGTKAAAHDGVGRSPPIADGSPGA